MTSTRGSHPIKSLDPSWLRGSVIGFINQEPVLFATTVMENICYGRPSATNDEMCACMRACVSAHVCVCVCVCVRVRVCVHVLWLNRNFLPHVPMRNGQWGHLQSSSSCTSNANDALSSSCAVYFCRCLRLLNWRMQMSLSVAFLMAIGLWLGRRDTRSQEGRSKGVRCQLASHTFASICVCVCVCVHAMVCALS